MAESSPWDSNNPNTTVTDIPEVRAVALEPVVVVPLDVGTNSEVRDELAELAAKSPRVIEICTTPQVHPGPVVGLPRPVGEARYRTHYAITARHSGRVALQKTLQFIFH